MARIHADQGYYGAAAEILASACARFPPSSSPHAHFWLLTEHQTAFARAWHQAGGAQESSAAEHAICALASINSLEALYCRCLLLLDRGDASTAVDLSDHLLTVCRRLKSTQQPLSELITRVLLVKGQALCATGNAMLASQPMLDALTLAKQSHLSYMATLATVHLAFVQYSLGLPREALRLLTPALVPMTSHASSLFERARAHFLASRCRVALAPHPHSGPPVSGPPASGPSALDRLPQIQQQRRRKVLLQQVDVMEKVVDWFDRLKAGLRQKQALHFLALLYNEVGGSDDQRNRCAQLFRQLNAKHPSGHIASIF